MEKGLGLAANSSRRSLPAFPDPMISAFSCNTGWRK